MKIIKKRIAILGSTGSIGQSALDVILRHPQHFEVVILSAQNNTEKLLEQCRRFRPLWAACSQENLSRLQQHPLRGTTYVDNTEIPDILSDKRIDIVLLAITGAAALLPFLAAIRAGKLIAPANKEALVIAGDILMREAKKHGATIIPVDSEQSAIFQCLEGRNHNDIEQIHLTASGGPLLHIPKNKHDKLSVKDVLAHPRWKMGPKITIDSATLMNKGFEVIEAQRLFSLKPEQVHVVIHPQAIIHSLVEFKDGSLLAQLSQPDMRLPIQYAFSYPSRLPSNVLRLDLPAMEKMTFLKPDTKRFPALELAICAGREGGTMPAVLNAANEVAVEAFLKNEISFGKIVPVVEKVLSKHLAIKTPTLAQILQADSWARNSAKEFLRRIK